MKKIIFSALLLMISANVYPAINGGSFWKCWLNGFPYDECACAYIDGKGPVCFLE